MTATRLLALSLALTGISHAACVACDDIGCDAGFFWTGSSEAIDALAIGAYSVGLEIEGSSYALECTVVAEAGASMCTQPVQTGGDVDFFVMFELAFKGGAPPHGFFMRAWEEDGERSLRGPREVRISISHAAQKVVDVTYELEYVRDASFWGDRRCGYCDLSETRSVAWE